jgi:hypothetical protein
VDSTLPEPFYAAGQSPMIKPATAQAPRTATPTHDQSIIPRRRREKTLTLPSSAITACKTAYQTNGPEGEGVHSVRAAALRQTNTISNPPDCQPRPPPSTFFLCSAARSGVTRPTIAVIPISLFQFVSFGVNSWSSRFPEF